MVLVQFANKLKEKVRRDDVVVRFGGEEFIIILKKGDEINAANIAQMLRKHIQTSMFTVTDNRTIRLTCSLGFIFYSFHECDAPNITFTEMISIADKAMYYAKTHGRNASVKAVFVGSDTNNWSINADKTGLKTDIEKNICFEII